MAAQSLFFPGGVLALSSLAADRLLQKGDPDAALLYLQFLRLGESDRERARRALKWTEDRVYQAWSVLEGLKLVDPASILSKPEKLESNTPPEYTAADLTQEMEREGSPFPFLLQEVENALGKKLSSSDLKLLLTIYDYYSMPAEVILILLQHCIREAERKYGPGRRPTVNQIRREALCWLKAGADTVESADAYLKRLDKLKERENRLLPLLGIQGRTAVESERKYLTCWIDWGFPDEAISIAYDRTLLRKGCMNWAYLNSILKHWHAAGLHTPEQIELGDSRRKSVVPTQATGPVAPPQATAAAEARARDDMERMRRFLDAEKRKAGENG